MLWASICYLVLESTPLSLSPSSYAPPPPPHRPHSLLGSRDSVDSSFTIDVLLTGVNGSALVCARLAGTTDSQGVVVALDGSGSWNVTSGMSAVQRAPAHASGAVAGGFAVGTWHTVRLDVNGTLAHLWVDGAAVFTGLDVSWATASGHNGIGAVQFGHYTEFDNVALYSTHTVCTTDAPRSGDAIVAVPCASEIGPRAGGQFVFTPSDVATCPHGSPCAGSSGAFALASDPTLCLAAAGDAASDWPVTLQPCDAGAPAQVFTQAYRMLYSSSIVHTASGRTVCFATQDIGSPAMAYKGGKGGFCGDFVHEGGESEIVSINAGSVCWGTC